MRICPPSTRSIRACLPSRDIAAAQKRFTWPRTTSTFIGPSTEMASPSITPRMVRGIVGRAQAPAPKAAQSRANQKLAIPDCSLLAVLVNCCASIRAGGKGTLYILGWKTAKYGARKPKGRSARITIRACQICRGAGESRFPPSRRWSTA